MLVALVSGIVAGLVSLARLWLGDSRALTEVLWAEDGLFPLCIHKADAWTCMVDPFAGYLLFLPRATAWPVSWLPWEYWAVASNITAALILGIVSAVVVRVLRQAGMGWFVAVAAGLLPALAPMVGLEAINAVGSSYMLLLYLSTLVIAFPPAHGWGRAGVIGGFVLLLITALTIPSAVVLLVALAIMWARVRLSRRVAVPWILALLAGLLAQGIVVINAEAPRSINFGLDTLNAWADAIPVSLLTYWPGLSIGEYSFFTNFSLAPVAITGWLLVIGIATAGVVLAVRGSGRWIGAGVLLLAGLGLGLIPSAIGYTNNRYFIVPLLLWGAALLVALDSRIRRTKPWILALVTAVVLVIWWPAMPVSEYRSTPAPEWTAETARIETKCLSDPGFVDRPLFTPFWPPNWGDGLSEPTHPNLPCTVVWRWIGESSETSKS